MLVRLLGFGYRRVFGLVPVLLFQLVVVLALRWALVSALARV